MALDRALEPHLQSHPLGMARRKTDTAPLEERLGYHFEDKQLLACALTHVSASGGAAGRSKNYQRLEFLGDRVLGLAIAEMLFATFPNASEGDLSQRLSELVRRDTCAEVALAWDVGPYLKLGGGDVQSGGRKSRPILADVCEAIIGAVFLDGGYDAAKALVERAFSERMTTNRRLLRDPKTVLQEWAQGRGLPTPTYRLVEQTGPDHAPRFSVEAKVGTLEVAVGSAATKREAERDAAQNLLLRERVWPEPQHG
jgi:ribonuclease III